MENVDHTVMKMKVSYYSVKFVAKHFIALVLNYQKNAIEKLSKIMKPSYVAENVQAVCYLSHREIMSIFLVPFMVRGNTHAENVKETV